MWVWRKHRDLVWLRWVVVPGEQGLIQAAWKKLWALDFVQHISLKMFLAQHWQAGISHYHSVASGEIQREWVVGCPFQCEPVWFSPIPSPPVIFIIFRIFFSSTHHLLKYCLTHSGFVYCLFSLSTPARIPFLRQQGLFGHFSSLGFLQSLR